MDQRTNQILFMLLRSAIRGTKLTKEELEQYTEDMLPDLLEAANKQDLVHLLVLGLRQNGLISKEQMGLKKHILKAVLRYEKIQKEYEQLCEALENLQIPFLPLKGSVIRKYYPEPWMRTSCDIDVLVHREDLDRAILGLTEVLKYEERERGTHDVSLFSISGVHVELHYDLVEEGRANNAIDVLRTVWENVSLHEDTGYWYEMSDAFYYFYHIAHMAKHFENGGCGIRPFIDLWILDHMEGVDQTKRDVLLEKGDLLKFTQKARVLSEVWFDAKEADEISLQLQSFLLHGGLFGTSENRVALKQTEEGGQMGYLISRIFVPYEKLQRYYPVLEKHRWLMPFMQVRRWFMLLKPDVAKMAKSEMTSNRNISKSKADEMKNFLDEIGL